MAARHTTINCGADAPTLLTDGAVTVCRVHNLSSYSLYLQATETDVAPASSAGAVTLSPGATLAADIPLAELFPGVGSGALYLWALADVGGALSVSHA